MLMIDYLFRTWNISCSLRLTWLKRKYRTLKMLLRKRSIREKSVNKLCITMCRFVMAFSRFNFNDGRILVVVTCTR